MRVFLLASLVVTMAFGPVAHAAKITVSGHGAVAGVGGISNTNGLNNPSGVISVNPFPTEDLVILVPSTVPNPPANGSVDTAIYRSKIYNAQGKAIGNVRLTQGRQGAFAGTLKLGARVYRFSGKFDANGQFHRNLTKTRAPLALNLQLTNFGGQRFLTGNVGHGAASIGVMPLTPGVGR